MSSETWSATPRGALWYGEIIYGRTLCEHNGPCECDPNEFGMETGSADGYSADALPDPSEMCPAGFEVLEETLTPISREA